MNPQLVVLAAGLSTRYGGTKQLEAVGPGEATLMEYSLYDARRAGFGEAVFVIRDDLREAFTAFAAARFGSRLPWRTAIQRLEDVPPGVPLSTGRVKPWGTVHAVLAAAPAIRGAFAVLNADDFYGAEAFQALAGFLRGAGQGDEHAVVVYRLCDTFPEGGAVNRAICRIGAGGWIEAIEEVVGLTRAAEQRYAGVGVAGPVLLDGDALVSMNLWGFTPGVLAMLGAEFEEFARSGGTGEKEYVLSAAIDQGLRRGRCRVRVLDPKSRWLGMTYLADLAGVQSALRRLVAEGRYPERLWA